MEAEKPESSDEPLPSTPWREMFRARAQKRRNPLITVSGLVTAPASCLKGPMTVGTRACGPRDTTLPWPFMSHTCACVCLSASARPGGHTEAHRRLLHGETSVFCRTSTVSDVLLLGAHFFNKMKMRHGNQGNHILNVYRR